MKDEVSANYTGNQLEKFIQDRLIERKYQFVSRTNFKATVNSETPIYSKQFHVGNGIYDTPLFCDFILHHPTKWPDCLIIESKWQQSGGSVDEKFPYFVQNIKSTHLSKTVILLDGGGYKKNAELWLRNQVGDNLIHVFNMGEFQKWANKGGI
jgi:hypothetical protein